MSTFDDQNPYAETINTPVTLQASGDEKQGMFIFDDDCCVVAFVFNPNHATIITNLINSSVTEAKEKEIA